MITTANLMNGNMIKQEMIDDNMEHAVQPAKQVASAELLKNEILANAFARLIQKNLITKATEADFSEEIASNSTDHHEEPKIPNRLSGIPQAQYIQLASALIANKSSDMKIDYEHLIELARQQQHTNPQHDNVSLTILFR